MSGDWIKMRANLLTHPKVVRMMSALRADKFRTVGGLLSAWCLFDAHSIDGRLSGYTLDALDAMAAWPGFAAAMVAVEWLIVEEVDGVESLVLPRFDSHNGQSAKRRAQEADRKRSDRKTSASDADKKRTREEKRREEKEQEHVIDAGAKAEADKPAEPTPAGQTCRLLRALGLPVTNPSHAELIALLNAGCEPQEIADTAAELIASGKQVDARLFGYVLSVVRNRRADAASKPAIAPGRPKPNGAHIAAPLPPRHAYAAGATPRAEGDLF